ncbi:MAG: PKD domain-containing protein [Thermoanaerobaculia bacterium]
MTRLLARVAGVVFATMVALPSLLSAQAYPMPASDSEPPVICTTCADVASANKPTWPYSMPVKAFTGRYVDSQATQGYQHGTGYRTVRAKKVVLAPERDRVYVIAGEGLEIFDYDSFFSTSLRPDGANLVYPPGARAIPGTTREKYLRGQHTIYAEWKTSGWVTSYMDGQERLYDFDYDDRGYLYLAYTIFGWGIHQDKVSSVPLIKQMRTENAKAILSIRSGSSYYALVSNWQILALYDTTNPTSPVKVGTVTRTHRSMATTNESVPKIAHVDEGGNLNIYTVNGLRTGQPFYTLAGQNFGQVTTDGTNFYVSGPNELNVLRPSGDTFVRETYPSHLKEAQTLQYGKGGFLAAGGRTSGWAVDAAVWRLDNGAPQPIELNGYFSKYYQSPPAGYAKPLNYTEVISDARVEEHNGKVLFFWSNYGLGDVYELQAAESINIGIDTAAGYGARNPFSKGGNGLFYGDPVTFKSSFAPGPIQIDWNFDNQGAPGNSTTSTTGNQVVYQYSGLTTAAAITTQRNVTARAITNSSNSDSVTVNMATPMARLAIQGTDLLFLQPNASSPAPIVAGDHFVDASDGSVAGHYTKWSLDGEITDRLPSEQQPVGACGAHSLSFAPQYGPYTLSAGVASPSGLTSRFAPSPITLNYQVRPFVPSIDVAASNANSITFENATRVSTAAFATGLSTPVEVVWRHVNASGADIVTPVMTRALTLADLAGDTFKITSKPHNSKVLLTVTVAADQISEVSCATLVEASAEFVLAVPDPAFDLSGCLTAGQPCTATARSASNQSMSDWTYVWTLTTSVGTSTVGTTASIDLEDALKPGSNTLKLKASNAIGETTTQQSWSVLEPPCSGAPASFSITYVGINTGCTTCTTREPLNFRPYYFNYVPQDCDTYEWSWGDGSPKTVTKDLDTVHSFPGNGPYTVSLVVKNDDGQKSGTTTVQFGTPTPPPPPPPPPPTPCATKPGQYADFTVSCGTDCQTGQAISFQYSNWGYTPQSCDKYSWSFGDNTSSTATNPQKTYSQPGTYNVTLTVHNEIGSVSKTRSVTVGGGGTTNPPPPGTCTTPPSGSIGLTWVGDDSGCTPGSNCNLGEDIAFTASVFFYTPQSCDTWEWDFGDGTKGTGQTAKHKYASFGTYQVTVKIKNNAGEKVGETKSLLVGDLGVAKPTSVDFTWTPNTPIVGKPVTLTASSSGGDPVTNWKWTFGEFGSGIVKTGQSVVHTFSTAGPWEISLQGSNAGGAAPTLTRQINVAAENAYAFLLPVVTHGAGHNGSLWRTDLQIYYPYQGEEVELEFELRSATLTTTKIMRLDRSTLISEDFMSFFTDGDNSGPVIVRGNTEKLPQIWTRTYNVASNGIGTYGQLIPAIRIETNENSATGPTTYYLPGVRLTNRFRTNIGLLNISGSPITVTLTAFEHSFGAAIGQFKETLEPYRFIQVGDGTLRTKFAGHSTEKAFSVMISGADEGALIAYESMIDNVSNDPVYVSAVPASLATDPGMKNQIVPGVGLFQSWKSDVAIFNPDDQAIQFDLSFYDEKGVLLSEAQNRILPAKGTLQINDIVNAPEMTPTVGRDVIGTLRLDVDSPLADKFPVVTDRTYNDQGAAGTYGQGIIGVPMSRPNVRTGKPAILPAVRQDLSYYTNLGLVNVGDESSTVLVSLLDKQSGQPIGTWSVTLVAGESIVASRILQAINATADNGSLKIEVTSGAPVWAYASVIDQMTKDPEYVPAAPLD